MGEEAIEFARSIKVEALRQLGNMLLDTPRNTGTRAMGGTPGGTIMEPPDDVPTLADMGLDKKTSSLAQDIASLSQEDIEKMKKGKMPINGAKKKVKDAKKKEKREEMVEVAKSVALPEIGCIDIDGFMPFYNAI